MQHIFRPKIDRYVDRIYREYKDLVFRGSPTSSVLYLEHLLRTITVMYVFVRRDDLYSDIRV